MPDVRALFQHAYKAITTDEGYMILYNYGWVDGGCWELARAIQDLYPESKLIAVTRAGNPRVEHVAAKWGPFIIDGTGVKSPASFKKYWSSDSVDGLGDIEVVPFDYRNVSVEEGISAPPLDLEKVRKIRKLIQNYIPKTKPTIATQSRAPKAKYNKRKNIISPAGLGSIR